MLRITPRTREVIDFLYFYPPSLWQAPTAPLHFLLQFRHFYHSMTGDPYLVLPSPYHFWDAFAVVELFTQLPLGVYFVYKVLSKSGVVDGPTELAGLAFACLNTMGSYVGCHDVWNMPPHLITAEAKNKVIFGEFGPYAVMCEFTSWEC